MYGVAYNWDVVKTAIKVERARLSWSQDQLAKRAKLSLGTVKNLEGQLDYKKVPSDALRAVDAAFSWPPGTLEEKLRAEGPVGPEPDYRIEQPAPGDIVALIRNVVFDAVIAAAPDTPISRVREIEERALEAAERAGFGSPRRRLPPHNGDDPDA